MKAVLTVRFEPELKDRLKKIAQEEKRSQNSMILKIISDYLKKHERRN